MSESQSSNAQAPEESLLDVIAREEGDPELFPDHVMQLFAEGKRDRARKVLLEHAGDERDHARANKQKALVSNLRLWIEPITKAPGMHTVNGFGTSLHGKYQPADDGTYISTLWIVALFVPIWPIRSYLVSPAESNAWHFLARAPLPPSARRVRKISRPVLIGLLGLIVWKVYWSGAHTDLYVFNGFDRAVVANVGADRSMVPPRRHTVFRDLALKATSVVARWAEDSAPFESLSVDLGGHGRHAAIYNVADRAVLGVDYVLYGDGTPKDGRWLERGPVVFVEEEIDYAFVTPPDSKSVSEGSSIENSVLHAVDDGVAPAEIAVALFNAGRNDQALAMARAELMVHPEDGQLAGFAARVLLRGDLDAQVALLRACLERAPREVDLHRAYQDVWPDDRRDALRAEYADLLAANSRSAMYHYLVGRLEPDGSDAAQTHFRAALSLDSKYPPAYRALAYHSTVQGRWAEALAHYDRFASLGTDQAVESLDPRVRLRRRLGRSVAEIARVISQTAAVHDQPLYYARLEAHLRLEARTATLAAETRRVLAVLRSKLGRENTSPLAHNTRADLAVSAGDLAAARAALREIPAPEQRSAAVALRIAASDAATPGDLVLMKEIPGWETELGQTQRLMALPLLDADSRGQLTASLDPDLARVAELLEAPDRLARPENLARVLSDQSPTVRAAAAFAAALASKNSGNAAARRAYLAEARSFALPGELP